MKLFMLILCAGLLGVTSTLWVMFGGYHNGINVITYSVLTVCWVFIILSEGVSKS